MNILGLDIGGASLKAADGLGNAAVRKFALWKCPEQLAAELHLIAASFEFDQLAVTMTGELCDCFATKAEGVAHILDAVAEAFPHIAHHRWIWQTSGRFVTEPQARTLHAWQSAAANWLALAAYCGRLAPDGNALLIDTGSTTTDLVLLQNGRPMPLGRTDPDRLATGELVYTGVERTPLCAIRKAVVHRDRNHRLMAELFATTLDVYLTLGDVADDPAKLDTADGRPATREFARDRLARMIGSDRTRFSELDARQLAEQFADPQVRLICHAVDHVISRVNRLDRIIVSGQGEFLARRVAARHSLLSSAPLVSLADSLGPVVSQCACAHAIAVLLAEHH